MKVAILGITGMLGSQVLKTFFEKGIPIVATCRDKSKVQNLPQNVQLKELNAEQVTTEEIQNILEGCNWCINCIGIIKPYIHDNNMDEVLRAIRVNSEFPSLLAKATKELNTQVIQIATDCVWDGVDGAYTETTPHNALDVYGKSKSLGEVQADNFYNIRCSIIGREIQGHLSLMDWFLSQPQGSTVKGFTNHLWNGVTTLQFAKLCLGLIQKRSFIPPINHVQHFVPSDQMNKHDLIHIFAEAFSRQDIKIKAFETPVVVDRTIQTQNTETNENLWKVAGYSKPPTLREMIFELKESL